MGFTTKWAIPKTVDFSDFTDDPEGTWWVRVRRSLSHAEDDKLTRKLVESTVQVESVQTSSGIVRRPKADANVSAAAALDYKDEVIVRSILEWNLTDDDDQVFPFGTPEEIRASLAQLPETVYDRLSKEISAAKKAREPEEEARFPSGDDGGDQSGIDNASDAGEVLV